MNEYGKIKATTKSVVKYARIKERLDLNVHMFQNMDHEHDETPIEKLAVLGIKAKVIELLNTEGYTTLKDLRNISEEMLTKVAKYKNLDQLKMVAKQLEKGMISLINYILMCEKGQRSFRVFLRRANGETLQKIAICPVEGNELCLTRERIRQLETAFFNKLNYFVERVFFKFMTDNEYLKLSDVAGTFHTPEFDTVVIYAGKMLKIFEYLDFAETFIYKQEESSYEERLVELAKEFVGEGINVSECIGKLEDMLVSNGFEFIEHDDFIRLLHKYRFYFYGDFVVYGKKSYAILCKYLVKQYFPNGIKITQNEVDEHGDIKRLRLLVAQYYKNVELPKSDRALSARLSDFMVLCDRGKLMPAENIQLEEEVLKRIRKAIDDEESKQIFYPELFAMFEDELIQNSNVTNHHFLHGVLKYYFSNLYNFSHRDYLLKTGYKDTPYTSLSERIRNFIFKMQRPVVKQELNSEFPGFTDSMLRMAILNDERLLLWEYNSFHCIDLLTYTQEDVQYLKGALEHLLEKNQGYTSDCMFYNYVKENFSNFLETNEMYSKLNLFYFVDYLFSHEFSFRRPHIALKDKFEEFNMKHIVLSLLDYPKVLDYDVYCKLADKMGWFTVTAATIFLELEQSYFRISQKQYVSKEDVHVSEAFIQQIENLLEAKLEYDVFPICNLVDFEEFPHSQYPWNTFYLGTLIEHYSSKFIVIYPEVKDRRYQKGILTPKDSGLSTYSAITAHVMRAKGIKRMSPDRFLAFLSRFGLTRKVIPKELTDAKEITCVDGQYTVK